jgi:PRC-barrel domain protein
MLRSLKDLERYSVSATDGDLGGIDNFLLDDERWVVRYLVVRIGGFLGGPRVLISPVSFRQADWTTHGFHLALTMNKILNSPGIDVNEPVSRQHEGDYFNYYGYQSYWGYPGLWGAGFFPAALAVGQPGPSTARPSRNEPGDAHLRSAAEVCGYRVQGSDEAIGHVADFVVDDETWEIRYLVVDIGHWWSGKKVLVSPHWTRRISWPDRRVYVDLPRDAIKGSPVWDPTAPVNREYEVRLYNYYGRPAYWAPGVQRRAEKPIHSGSPFG